MQLNQEKRILIIYDFSVQPLAVGDILYFQIASLILKEKLQTGKIDFAFVFDPKIPIGVSHFEHIKPEDFLSNFLSFFPTVLINPHIGSLMVFNSRTDLAQYINKFKEEYEIWPAEWLSGRAKYMFYEINSLIVDFIATGEKLPLLECHQTLTNWSLEFYKKYLYPYVPISVQLRNNRHIDPSRNNNPETWRAFFTYCEKRYPVKFIIIGNADEIDDRIKNLPNVIIAKDYQTRIDQDLALIQLSAFHMGANSGPIVKAIFYNKPYFFSRIPISQMYPEKMYRMDGDYFSFTFGNDQQKGYVGIETTEILINEFERMWEVIEVDNWWKNECKKNENIINYWSIQRPMFSVIIPIDVLCDFDVKKSIESVQAQQFSDWEVIIVLNENNKFIEHFPEFSEDKNGIKIITVSANKWDELIKYGLENAKGEWISILSAGDLYCSDRLSQIVENIKENPGVKILFTNYWINVNGNTEDLIQGIRPVSLPMEGGIFQTINLFSKNFICNSSLIIHRSIFERIDYTEALKKGNNFGYFFYFEANLISKTKYIEIPTVIIKNNQGIDILKENNETSILCLNFLNNHSFEQLFPDFDLNNRKYICEIVQIYLNIATNIDSIINNSGYINPFLDRLAEWITLPKNHDLLPEIKTLVLSETKQNKNPYFPTYFLSALQRLEKNIQKEFQYKRYNRKIETINQGINIILIKNRFIIRKMKKRINQMIKNS